MTKKNSSYAFYVHPFYVNVLYLSVKRWFSFNQLHFPFISARFEQLHNY